MKILKHTIILTATVLAFASQAFSEMVSIPLSNATENIAHYDWTINKGWRLSPLKSAITFDVYSQEKMKQAEFSVARYAVDIKQLPLVSSSPNYSPTTTLLRGFDAEGISLMHNFAAKLKMAGDYEYALYLQFDIKTTTGTYRLKSNKIDPTLLEKDQTVKAGPDELFHTWRWEGGSKFLGDLGDGIPLSELTQLDVCVIIHTAEQHTGPGTAYFIVSKLQVNAMIEHQ